MYFELTSMFLGSLFFRAEDGIRDGHVTGVQTCALPIYDAHTTMLMGAATILSKQPLKRGNIKFIFQPAEETEGGAESMIREGCLENPKVDVMAGLHVDSRIDTGNITVTEGSIGCASTDYLEIEVIGKGGHAAHPHQTVDSIAVAGEVITSLQQIVSRQIAPIDSVVVTLGTIEGGTINNVIAPSVKMTGTVRTLKDRKSTRLNS